LIGSESASAGIGNENDAAPNALALPNKTSRREMVTKNTPVRFRSAPVVEVAGVRFLILAGSWTGFVVPGFEPDAA
jgi:hypothetical protein